MTDEYFLPDENDFGFRLTEFILGEEETAKKVAYDFEKSFFNNSKKAISVVKEYINNAKNSTPGSAYDSLVGGPSPERIAPLFNTFGALYPCLDREGRKKILCECDSYLGSLNYMRAQDLVALIDEPWLASDIVVNSNYLYWPGYKQYADVLDKCETFDDFQPYFDKAKSSFFAAYAITRKNVDSEIRKDFYNKYPILLDRTLDGIAAILNFRAYYFSKRDNTSYDEELNDFMKRVHEYVHEKILIKIKEEKWIFLFDLKQLDKILG